MKKILTEINHKVNDIYFTRYFSNKVTKIETTLYRYYKWLRHFIPYEYFTYGDDEIVIHESVEDVLETFNDGEWWIEA